MALIEWRAGFAIGLPEVDHEHRELIDTINRLHAELGAGADVARLAGALGEIHASIAAHFALEEKNMAALGYDELAAHKADHERLLDEILDVMDEVHAAGRYDPDAMSRMLAGWFGEHFRTHDARLHRWLVHRS
jgi:hemerythrin-like metal-binding protein